MGQAPYSSEMLGEFGVRPEYALLSASTGLGHAAAQQASAVDICWHKRSRRKCPSTWELIRNALDSCKLSEGLEEADFKALCEAAEFYIFNLGDCLVREGEVCTHLFIPEDEGLDVMLFGGLIANLPPGMVFGESSILDGCPQGLSLVATRPTIGVWAIEGRLLREAHTAAVLRRYSQRRQQSLERIGETVRKEDKGTDSSQMRRLDSSNDVLSARARTLRRVCVFRNLPQEELFWLAGRCQQHIYPHGAKIMVQGDPGSHFFMVIKGTVHVVVDGRVLRRLVRFNYFGERSLLSGRPVAATILVHSEEAEIWAVSKGTFLKIAHEKDRIMDELKHRLPLQDTSIKLKHLQQEDVIGSGTSGIVRVVRHIDTKARYALKRVGKVDGQANEAVKREMEVLAENNHPFIIHLVKTFETAKNVYMLTEYVCGGELHAAIRTIDTVLSRKQAMFYIGSLLLVLEELYDRHVVYRDLKPENVMLDSGGYVKLIDFGTAKKLEGHSSRTFSTVGTPHYMAPEAMQDGGYGTEVDVWALGVILYEMVVGWLPFGVNDLETAQEVFAAVLAGKLDFPPNFPQELESARYLIVRLLEPKPHLRLGCGESSYEEIKAAAFFDAGVAEDGESFGGPDYFEQLLAREVPAPIVPTSKLREEANQDNEDAFDGGAASSECDDTIGRDFPAKASCGRLRLSGSLDSLQSQDPTTPGGEGLLTPSGLKTPASHRVLDFGAVPRVPSKSTT